MSRVSPKYVVDTQLFINAFRDPVAHEAREALERFRYQFGPIEQLSVIVAQELLAGLAKPADRKALERHMLGLFERVGRIVTPSAGAWRQSGEVLAMMARRDGLELAKMSKAFANDILLALSCRETGCVLITENTRDFARIQRFVRFEFVTPWPGQ